MLVIDASVFIKLFRDEEDSAAARTMLDALIARNEPFLAPSIVLYEVLSNALHYERPFDEVADFFSALRPLGLSVEEPEKADLSRAETICTTKASIGGYPTMMRQHLPRHGDRARRRLRYRRPQACREDGASRPCRPARRLASGLTTPPRP